MSAPPRSKRIKKDQVIVISSDSDSDENVGVAGTRRKKLRVANPVHQSCSVSAARDENVHDSGGFQILKANDENESSGSSGVFVATRRRVSSFSSDRSDGNSEKCSICLKRFTSQEVGTPKNCEHMFCLDCIIEWSKKANTCPVDRKPYTSIVVRACAGGRVLRTQPCVRKTATATRAVPLPQGPILSYLYYPFEIDYEDLPSCEVCDTRDREENMLQCQRCDALYHVRCLTPRLGRIPYIWFCMPCRNSNHEHGWIDPMELDEIMDAERSATIPIVLE